MVVAGVLLPLLALALFLYYRFVYGPHKKLKWHGIPGPSASFFYGNYKERLRLGVMKYTEQLHAKYGPTVGYYMGTTPIISTMDLELIKRVTVKEFSNFTNRQDFPDLMRKKTTKKRSLLLARDNTWRSSRQILSPAFSTSKMKAMTPLMADSVHTLVEILAEVADTGKSVEVHKTYGLFTLETLLATAFGRIINVQRGESDDLVEVLSEFFGRRATAAEKKPALQPPRFSQELMLVVLSNFPWLVSYFRSKSIGSKRQKNYELLSQMALKIIQARRKEAEPGKYKDLLQHMLDVGERGVNEGEPAESQRMDDAEIASHSNVFIMAGYETTANALTFISHLLASHPQIQEKLQKEIDDYYNDNSEDTSQYQAAMEIEYLDMVVQESLRFYPPAFSVNRECASDYRYNDITIPAGAVVNVPIFLIHKDSDHWKDPDVFEPSRFTVEEKAKRPPLSHMPFGYGPRNCIGMRFALLEAKIALIEIMRKFSFATSDETKEPLELELGLTMRPKHGMFLKINNRAHN